MGERKRDPVSLKGEIMPRRYFHDDQYYRVGKDDQARPWWAVLLWPFKGTTIHRAADEGTVHKMAKTEIVRRKEGKK